MSGEWWLNKVGGSVCSTDWLWHSREDHTGKKETTTVLVYKRVVKSTKEAQDGKENDWLFSSSIQRQGESNDNHMQYFFRRIQAVGTGCKRPPWKVTIHTDGHAMPFQLDCSMDAMADNRAEDVIYVVQGPTPPLQSWLAIRDLQIINQNPREDGARARVQDFQVALGRTNCIKYVCSQVLSLMQWPPCIALLLCDQVCQELECMQQYSVISPVDKAS
ncbi:hypothetical protein J437_LFUL014638 [Ladona fulva]|uniref:Uncharacterized protein n=1 Tax=Ladona fulva TaxID=123851 RepID=A0A8K0KG06_LADFU|nr:hypothetical protein J437_LFUL014638 [Ladona fulva]